MFVPEKVNSRIIFAVLIIFITCLASCRKQAGIETAQGSSFPVATLFEEDIQIPVLPLSPRGRTTRIQELEYIRGDLIIPSLGEAARYPSDFLLGPLLTRADHTEAYEYTATVLRSLVSAATARNSQETVTIHNITDTAKMESAVHVLSELDVRLFRIASGHQDSEDDFSYTIRFIGSEKAITGSIYLRIHESRWILDDIQLDPAVNLHDERGVSYFDPFIYTKFL